MRRPAASPRRLALALVFAPAVARAEPGRELRGTTDVALGVETGAIAVGGVAGVLVAGARPKGCSWCVPGAFDRSGNASLARDDLRTAALVSHAPSFVILPLGGLAGVVVPALREDRPRHAVENAWILSNAFFLTMAVTETTKRGVGRRRPVFLHGRSKQSEFDTWPTEENLSFFSGDTAAAFQLAASASTLAFLRGYRVAPLLAASGGALATSTAVLRVASEAHWPTDVLTGALVGTVIGVGLPLALHGRAPKASAEGGQPGPMPLVSLGGAF